MEEAKESAKNQKEEDKKEAENKIPNLEKLKLHKYQSDSGFQFKQKYEFTRGGKTKRN